MYFNNDLAIFCRKASLSADQYYYDNYSRRYSMVSMRHWNCMLDRIGDISCAAANIASCSKKGLICSFDKTTEI